MKKILKNKINNLVIYTKAQKLLSKTLFNGNFIKVIEEKYLLPNNKTIIREKIIKNENKNAVIIIPMTPHNKLLLVSQNRVGGNVSLEFPSGYIEEGETVIDGAKRELREETGYEGTNFEIIDKYSPLVGIDNSTIYIVIAYNCEKNYPQNLSDSEYIKYDIFTFNEMEELINENIIDSGGTKLAFYKLTKILLQNELGNKNILLHQLYKEREDETNLRKYQQKLYSDIYNQEEKDIDKTIEYLKTLMK